MILLVEPMGAVQHEDEPLTPGPGVTPLAHEVEEIRHELARKCIRGGALDAHVVNGPGSK